MIHVVSPLIHRIARDRRLTAIDVRVWLSVAGVVGYEDYVSLKLQAIARDVGCHSATVHRCLQRLVQLMYLERAKTKRTRGAMEYRLPKELQSAA